MLFLQGEAVADGDPGLWGVQGALEGGVGQITQLDLLFEMPQAAGIILNSLQTVRLEPICLSIVLLSLSILHNLHKAPANIRLHPSRIQLIRRQLLELVDGLRAVVH